MSNRSSFFDMHASRQPHVFLPFFLPLEMSLFPSIFVPLPFYLCIGEYLARFPLPDVFFSYLVTTSGIFYTSLCKNSIN